MPAEEWFIVSLLLTFQRAQVHHKEEDIVCLHCYRVTRHQPPALTRSSRLHLALCVNIKRLTLAWCLLHPKSGFLFISLCIHISSFKHSKTFQHRFSPSYFLDVSDNVILRWWLQAAGQKVSVILLRGLSSLFTLMSPCHVRPQDPGTARGQSFSPVSRCWAA